MRMVDIKKASWIVWVKTVSPEVRRSAEAATTATRLIALPKSKPLPSGPREAIRDPHEF
jgi:hypothetical protein